MLAVDQTRENPAIITLDSPSGHLSFACISVGPIVGQFLADPASVRTQTLHEEMATQ